MTSFTTLVEPRTLALHLAAGWVIVDCRHDLAAPEAGERAYAEAHIPGACFLHLDRDLAGATTGSNGRHPLPPVDRLAAALGAIGVTDGVQVVAYDQGSGVFAARLWWQLRALGHERVAVLDGGLDRWLREGRPVDAGAPNPVPAQFLPSREPAIASAGEILAQLEAASLTVIDARAAARFRGEHEPLDPVAGHIPGALNRPHTANLTSAGIFKPPEALRAEFAALLGRKVPASVVHQCGSGVTACHNLLAMQIAGLPGSRLYPGSWSEWCADPARPVARGP